MEVRAVGADLFMQLSTWEEPLAGCWLRTGPGQVPGGQLAMTPGVPGFITLLGALRPEVVVTQDGDTIVLGADLPLRIGFQLLTTGVLGLVQLDASQLNGASVPVGVKLTGGVLTDVELQGGSRERGTRGRRRRAARRGDHAEPAADLGELQARSSRRATGDGSRGRPGHDQRRREGEPWLLEALQPGHEGQHDQPEPADGQPRDGDEPLQRDSWLTTERARADVTLLEEVFM